MKNKFKKTLLLSSVPLLLGACANNADEKVDEEPVEEKVEISNVQVDVTTAITEAVEKIDGSVVSVLNLQKNNFNSWDSFYGEPASEEEYLEAGSGSGAVYKVTDDLAYIFTNNHVVEGSDVVEVLFQDGTRIEATVEGTDVWTDLAVLSIDSKNIDKNIEFGNSDKLKVGEPAIAIGSPLGTEFASSVTDGIISGVGRTVPVDTDGDKEYDWEMSAIQTNAVINPGNSGGPLINISGQVIGINSMKISSSTVEGMGFAIPSNDAVDIINQLEKEGEIIRPNLGITMIDLAYISKEQKKEELNLDADLNKGVVITRVINGSSAAEAGMQPRDVIVGFNGEEVTDSVRLRQLLYTSEVGEKVEIEYYRDGQPKVLNLEMMAAEN
ncbi:MAG: trypsin-like peptidase domain-containing protein [Atopostipes suicloacalis]|nr:trypsin-like peptidase domain-containing protein [Atopostipes suicloacalis]MDN6731822.1 trypsin-like peptidase domain-containing protein [Atopostipes suicloacalis]